MYIVRELTVNQLTVKILVILPAFTPDPNSLIKLVVCSVQHQ